MNRGYRQAIIDEYLNDTGANSFMPKDFLEWLRERPTHRAYALFFSADDEEAAEQFRLQLVRQFIAGLRIKVAVSTAPSEAKQVNVTVSMPAYISPVGNRRGGGGYIATDINDPETMREMARQAATDLRRVLERHDGIGKLSGIDMSPLAALASMFDLAAMAPAQETIAEAAE
jgi:hypothetical protein